MRKKYIRPNQTLICWRSICPITETGELTKIYLAAREYSLRAYDTPDDAGCTGCFDSGTNEPVLLVRGTHVRDIAEHPCLHAELHSSCDHSGHDLTYKTDEDRSGS